MPNDGSGERADAELDREKVGILSSTAGQLIFDFPEDRGISLRYPGRNHFVTWPRGVRDDEAAFVGLARGARDRVFVGAIDHFDGRAFAGDGIDARLCGSGGDKDPRGESKECRHMRDGAAVIAVCCGGQR